MCWWICMVTYWRSSYATNLMSMRWLIVNYNFIATLLYRVSCSFKWINCKYCVVRIYIYCCSTCPSSNYDTFCNASTVLCKCNLHTSICIDFFATCHFKHRSLVVSKWTIYLEHMMVFISCIIYSSISIIRVSFIVSYFYYTISYSYWVIC